jgi:hypothetical protein
MYDTGVIIVLIIAVAVVLICGMIFPCAPKPVAVKEKEVTMDTKYPVEVWTKRGREYAPLCVWRGYLPRVPAVDEYITIHEGWGGARVLDVAYSLADNSVSINIGPDDGGEYRDHLKKVPLPKWKDIPK